MTTGLQLRNLNKRFGAVQALKDVCLDFVPGEVHAVLGENGAGKSTLVNIVAGIAAPDSGTVTAGNRELPGGDPIAARRVGLGVVHQHFTLVPSFTTAENIALFRMRAAPGPFSIAALAAPAFAKAVELGWNIDPLARVGSLSVGAKQRIEILKSICDDEPILLFDEPTAPLGPEEVEDLLGILRKLAEQGKVVVLIAHKLKEVMAVADRVSVLRRGVVQAASLRTQEVTADQLAELMVGELPDPPQPRVGSSGAQALAVENLEVRGESGALSVRRVSFAANAGEIFGIGGVDGNGQVELAEALAGIRPYRGSIRLGGHPLSDVAYIPADRQSDGLALGMTVRENLLLGRMRSWPTRREVDQWSIKLIKEYDVKSSSLEQAVAELSGGNQQKLVVARSLDRHPPVVIAVNPTRGLDLKATAFVYNQLRRSRDQGACVILVSADLDELYSVADRVSFMSAGDLSAATGAESLVGGSS